MPSVRISGPAAVLAALVLAGCGSSATPPTATVTQVVTQSASVPSETPAPETPSPSESSAEETPSAEPTPETFVMPKVVGMILQDAQDLLQTKGSYLMDQKDATGLDRFQLDDSNWKVCTQKPKAGSKVPIETVVVLSAVKLRETCP
jgi:PASTA domain